MKFYAVKIGREPGLYHTWAEAKEQVYGYKGALYKSFTSIVEAQQFLAVDLTKGLDEPNEWYAYVDGSNTDSEYSYGLALVYNGEVVEEHCGKGNNPEWAKLRNVTGELTGAMMAVELAKVKGITNLNIVHDYIGIGAWADKMHSANQPHAVSYVQYMDKARETMNITFVKVKGHTGNEFNELADKLAKQALGIEKRR